MKAEVIPQRLTVDEFLAWAGDRPGRFELERGRVLAMSPERVRHAEVKGVAYRALSAACQAAGDRCRALPDGLTVRIDAETAYEPDALVYCGPKLSDDAVEVPNPVIVIEVLSPSTAYRDVGVKLAGYFACPSVQHYLVIDPDRPVLVHHARDADGLIATRICSEGSLALNPPGLALDVTELLA